MRAATLVVHPSCGPAEELEHPQAAAMVSAPNATVRPAGGPWPLERGPRLSVLGEEGASFEARAGLLTPAGGA
ncbi:hypothetical protein [Nonomuraea sp. B19D2]|uniref:hypothetical protein n=1 Tax=Nonomuraea sp. B19D2 TaxID=3159561 RepID=UPI0032DA99F4